MAPCWGVLRSFSESMHHLSYLRNNRTPEPLYCLCTSLRTAWHRSFISKSLRTWHHRTISSVHKIFEITCFLANNWRLSPLILNWKPFNFGKMNLHILLKIKWFRRFLKGYNLYILLKIEWFRMVLKGYDLHILLKNNWFRRFYRLQFAENRVISKDFERLLPSHFVQNQLISKV